MKELMKFYLMLLTSWQKILIPDDANVNTKITTKIKLKFQFNTCKFYIINKMYKY
jgi:hypothetical protein